MHRTFLRACTLASLCLFLPAIAIAGWQPGYEAPGLHGGQPFAAAEWNGAHVFGGSFAGAAAQKSPGVVQWDGAKFSALGAGLTPSPDTPNSVSGVQDLLVHEGTLLAAGAFSRSGSREVGCVARFENGEWWPLGEPLEGAVWDLESYEGGVVAIGPFTGTEDGVAGIAWFDGEAWQPLGERPPRSSALAVHLGELYAGFHRWNGREWEALATTIGGDVTAMLSTPEGLVLAGEIFQVDGEDVFGILRWNGQSVEQLGGGSWLCDGDVGFYVYERPAACSDLLYHEGELYALAGFMASQCTFAFPYAGSGLSYGEGYAYALARFDGSDWVEVGASRALFPAEVEHRYGELAEWSRAPGALVVSGDGILVAGDFPSIDGAPAASLARLDAQEEWHALVEGRGRADVPRVLHLHDGELAYWDGEFEVSGLDRTEHRLRSPYHRLLDHVETPSGDYFLGRDPIGGHVGPPFLFPLITSWDSQMSLHPGHLHPGLGVGWDSQASLGVWWPDHGLVLAQEPTHITGFEALEPGVDLLVVDPQTQLLRASTRIPSGAPEEGEQTVVGGLVVHQGQVVFAMNGEVLRWNGSVALDWDPNDPDYVPQTTGVARLGDARFDGKLRALAVAGGRLYVAGSFGKYGKESVPHLAEWNGEAWVAPAWGSPNGAVRSMSVTPTGDLWIAGDFTEVGGMPTAHVAVVRGDRVGPLPEGPDGPVHQIVGDGEGIWVAGPFEEVAGLVAHHLARWTGNVTALALDDDGDDAGEIPPTPARVELMAPYPNPFNPQVEVGFRLPRAQFVRLEIYDLAGRRVRELWNGAQPAGTHQRVWDGTDDDGRAVASGSYFLRLRTEERVQTRKLVLVR